ncbi:MAG: HAD family phosphatase [Phycisphaerae bacterium]
MTTDGQIARGAIFDIDGVLVDSYQQHLESWRRLAAELDQTVTNDAFDRTFGRTSREIIAMLFGPQGSQEAVRRLDDRKEAIYRELVRGRVPVMDGALELVSDLFQSGFRMALGSSGPPENVDLVFRELGLDRWMMARVSGADVIHGKPHPEVFQLACRRLGLAPEHSVVIEDAPVGVEAARRAGCHAIALLSTHSAGAFDGSVTTVARLSDLSAKRLGRMLSGSTPGCTKGS